MEIEQPFYHDEQLEKADLRNVPKNILKEFIKEYKAHPALWQIRNKEVYNNRHFKIKGYNDLLKIWKRYDPEADQNSVKLKIQSIRGSFRKELRKVQKSERSGSGEIYRSRLWYYSMLSFLVEQESSAHSNNSDVYREASQICSTELDSPLDEDESSEDTSLQISEPPNNINYKRSNKEQTFPIRNRKQKKIEESEGQLNMEISSPSRHGESEAFSIYINSKLEKILNAEQRMYAESLLSKVLNKAIMGKLTENSDIVEKCV